MSNFPHGPTTSDKVAVALLAAPLLVLGNAASRIARQFKRTPATKAAIPAPPAPQSEPNKTPNTAALVADRVYSVLVHGEKVSFFLYFVARQIRISTRVNRVVREVIFTPEIAQSSAVSFDIDGAIEWVRKNGVGPIRPVESMAAAKPKPSPPKPRTAASANATQLAEPTLEPPAAGKGKPFTGRILFLGETTRSSEGGKRSYVTYSIKLESESGAYTKEFLGEHLSELAAEMKLSVGRVVTIQLLGRYHFQVEVDGKIEDRNRNQYAITAIK